MATARYPKATWKGDGNTGGYYVGKPYRVVLHTTETSGMPGYNGGGSAPHLTYDPKAHKWYQHSKLTTAARALRNPSGGVQTNRANALQVEIICYSNKGIADQASYRLWVGDLDDQAIADLQEFINWCVGEFGVEFEWPGKQAYSYSQANAAGFRMSGTAWNDFNGVCAHQHVPENTHWDTGALAWDKIMGDAITIQEDTMFPIKRGDGGSADVNGKQEDVRHYQYKLKEDFGKDVGTDGLADQAFLDAIFEIVGSPLGGSYFSGEEGRIFDIKWIEKIAGSGGAPAEHEHDDRYYTKGQGNGRYAAEDHGHELTFQVE